MSWSICGVSVPLTAKSGLAGTTLFTTCMSGASVVAALSAVAPATRFSASLP